MRVAIIGSRNCGSLRLAEILENVPSDCTQIISGGAVGVDQLARQAAKALNVPLLEFLPDYDNFGRMAPVIRNRTIVENADLVLAFWDYHSRGTRDAINKALKLEKEVKIVEIGPVE